MYNRMLSEAYSSILRDLDTMFLDRKNPHGSRPPGLSGMFLPSVREQYGKAKNKVMIVGSETAGWEVLKGCKTYCSLEDYIQTAVIKHKEFFEKELESGNSRGYSFHNFTRAVAKKCGKDGIVYSNLFCFDWKNGSPIRSPYYDVIKLYSEKLLKCQIEILNPDVIIFANGMTSVPFRRQCFPIAGDTRVCTNGRDYAVKGIKNHHLWEFDLHSRIRCFRVHHPSARAKAAVTARNFLIDLLPSA